MTTPTANDFASLDPRILRYFEEKAGFGLTAENLLMLCRAGSHSHGTYVPPTDPQAIDDVDYMAVVVPPAKYLFGLSEWDNEVIQRDELDLVFYSLRKFIGLLAKQNPNVLGTLWLHPRDYLWLSPTAVELVRQRDRFSSQEAYHSFMGYASAQLRKMTHFDTAAMARYEALTQSLGSLFDVRQQIIGPNGPDFDRWIQERSGGTVNEFVVGHMRELRKLHRQHFSGYMGEKRKSLVRKYGYDTKNAAHLLRLMRMCCEFLKDGILRVARPDAAELVQIKQGGWELSRVQGEAERLFQRAKELVATTPLPVEPDRVAIEQLSVDLHLAVYRGTA